MKAQNGDLPAPRTSHGKPLGELCSGNLEFGVFADGVDTISTLAAILPSTTLQLCGFRTAIVLCPDEAGIVVAEDGLLVS
jgi:hypothetical protein